MRAQGHGGEAGEGSVIDNMNEAAGDEGEDEAVGENYGAGAESGNDAVLELVEEIGSVHEGEGEASDGVFGEEFVDVAANEIGAAEAAGLHGETFGLQPFLKQSDLGGAAGAVHALDNDERAVQFGGIEADEGFTEKALRRLGFHNRGLRENIRRGEWRGDDEFFFFLIG